MLFKAKKTNGKKYINIDTPLTLNEYQERMFPTRLSTSGQ